MSENNDIFIHPRSLLPSPSHLNTVHPSLAPQSYPPGSNLKQKTLSGVQDGWGIIPQSPPLEILINNSSSSKPSRHLKKIFKAVQRKSTDYVDIHITMSTYTYH